MKNYLRVAGLVFAVLAAAGSGSAFAQSGSSSLTKNLGIKAGEFVVLPTFSAGAMYNSNLFYMAEGDANADPRGAWMLRFIPGLAIQTGKTAAIGLNVNGNIEYREYLSSDSVLTDQSKVAGQAAVRAEFLRNSPVQFTFNEKFSRKIERKNIEVSGTWDRNSNQIGGEVTLAPGGGAMKLMLGYNYLVDYFSGGAAGTNNFGDKVGHQIEGKYTWKFLPFTAFVADVNWQMNNYLADGNGAYGELTDSTPLKARFGLSGYFSKSVSMILMAGWGNSMHEKRKVAAGEKTNPGENDSYNSFLGDVKATWKPAENTTVNAGYSHDFRDSMFSNYVVVDGLKVGARQRLMDRIEFGGNLSYEHMAYATLPYKYQKASAAKIVAFGGNDRKDNMLRVGADGTVDVTRWLGVQLKYSFDKLMTDWFVTINSGGADIKEKMDYQVHVLEANLLFRY